MGLSVKDGTCPREVWRLSSTNRDRRIFQARR